MTDVSVRQQILHDDPAYRRLAQKHHECATRIDELQSHRFPTDEERVEEARLKKVKLRLKDEMEALVRRHAGTPEGRG